ncbi:alpha/beta hydrolase [Roseiconus lacunae]|uniref:Alpha/beta hydrolase n=1 Tax=Roseiconus lacunae TaxID=2605694 RepID=A0ABT7PR38_9BACT|nr:alpha/beta hydrolase [Roseiconus lacunae]MDM4018974.1 alpha/beta hydrolase [Roseiconus lacunae]WRQ51780.1 alpha/beta hydrolase [Stieleria sp. HD01]
MTKGRPKWKRRLIVIARGLFAGYVVILFSMVLLETRLLFPAAYREATPAAESLPTAWSYSAADGTTIVGQLIERPDAERTVLFFHGNGTYASRQIPWLEQLSVAWNANVVAAEYRSFVDDSITPSEANLVSDAISAFDATCDHFQIEPEQLIVFGRSLGGGCAAAVAQRRTLEKLVLDRTFDSAASVAASRYPFIPVRLLMRNSFDSAKRLREFQGTVIQIHGPIDRVVPYRHGRQLHEQLQSDDKHFITVDGLGHLDAMPDATLAETRGYLTLNEAALTTE